WPSATAARLAASPTPPATCRCPTRGPTRTPPDRLVARSRAMPAPRELAGPRAHNGCHGRGAGAARVARVRQEHAHTCPRRGAAGGRRAARRRRHGRAEPRAPHPGPSFARENLRAVWPNYLAAAPHIRLIVPMVVNDVEEVDLIRAAVPGARVTICETTAPVEVLKGAADRPRAHTRVGRGAARLGRRLPLPRRPRAHPRHPGRHPRRLARRVRRRGPRTDRLAGLSPPGPQPSALRSGGRPTRRGAPRERGPRPAGRAPSRGRAGGSRRRRRRARAGCQGSP